MFYIIFALLIISITQGYILLEEELLIIIASIVWVDAAGRIIKDLLETEVEYKGKIIKDKYLWFLSKKKDSYSNLLMLYSTRINFLNSIKMLQIEIMMLLINNSFLYFYNNFLILKRYNIVIKLINIGLLLIKKNFSQEILNILKILKENSIYLKKYSLLNYIINSIGNLYTSNILVYNS